MSDYYLVDKTLLDNGLKEIADAIRQSGGTTAKLSFPTGMVTAVSGIKAAPWWIDKMVNAPYLFQRVTLPEKCEFDFSFLPVSEDTQVNMTNLFGFAKGVKETTVTFPSSKKICIGYIFYGATTVEKVVFKGEFDFTQNPGGGILGGLAAFSMCSNLKTIESTATFGGKEFLRKEATAYNPFYSCAKLVDVRFTPNSAQQDWVFKWSPALSGETLVSAANALTVGSYTLTLHATAAARCAEITGTVSDGAFTASSSGTTTLVDFITTTKGWSLANG
ncbi:surface antigen BspA-like [Clostridium sp. CAG:413]|nr:surface antigen BspA-like [Clostridium sp. CAG:413]